MIGVVSLSGWERSTTSTSPLARAASNALTDPDTESPSVTALVRAECFLEPRRDDVRLDLCVDHDRAGGRAGSAPREPVRERCEIAGGAHRDGLGADGPADRGEVGIGELGQVDGVAQRPEVVHLGAVGGVVVDDDRHREAEAHGSLELGQRHHRAAVAECRHAQPVGARDRRADRGAEAESDRLERVREHEAALVRHCQVHRRVAAEVAGVGDHRALGREQVVERDRERARVDVLGRARVCERLVAPAPRGDRLRVGGSAGIRRGERRGHAGLPRRPLRRARRRRSLRRRSGAAGRARAGRRPPGRSERWPGRARRAAPSSG